jgi:hypothetical protein
MVRVNNANRDEIIDDYIETLLDSMDMDALIVFASERLHDELKQYGNAELHDLISRIYPELLEE